MSGTARVMLLFKLYFGAVLGMDFGKFIWGEVSFMPPDTMPV